MGLDLIIKRKKCNEKSILGQYFKTNETIAKQSLFRHQHFKLQGRFFPAPFPSRIFTVQSLTLLHLFRGFSWFLQKPSNKILIYHSLNFGCSVNILELTFVVQGTWKASYVWTTLIFFQLLTLPFSKKNLQKTQILNRLTNRIQSITY